MVPKELIYAAWAFAAGAGIPIMAVLNSGLARALGSASAAVVVLLLVGLAAALVVLGLTSGAGGLAAGVQADRAVGGWSWPMVTGGLIFVFYIFSATLLVPRFGVANTILCVVVAQIVVSAVIDHFGLFGMPVRPVDGLRMAGLGLVLTGLVLTQYASGRT
jgi:transporter family-2 protein